MPVIRFRRVKQLANCLKAFSICIDGEVVEKVGNGEIIDIDVDPGRYEVAVKMSLWRSKPISVTVSADRSLVIETGCHVQGWKLFVPFVMLWHQVMPGQYLYVHPKGIRKMQTK